MLLAIMFRLVNRVKGQLRNLYGKLFSSRSVAWQGIEFRYEVKRMQRVLTGTVTGLTEASFNRIISELVESTLSGYAIVQVLATNDGRVVITVDRPASDQLVGKYEVDKNVWLSISAVGRPVVLTDLDWREFIRQTPIPKRRASKTP